MAFFFNQGFQPQFHLGGSQMPPFMMMQHPGMGGLPMMMGHAGLGGGGQLVNIGGQLFMVSDGSPHMGMMGGVGGLSLAGLLGLPSLSSSASSSSGYIDDDSRSRRLRRRVVELYHQTSRDVADTIVREQKMIRGSGGLAGGGIYFAESPSETMNKAHNHGAILKATVLLGSQKTISSSGDGSITFDSLLREGYDSVLIPRHGGTEHVVYNYDQVRDISIHSYA